MGTSDREREKRKGRELTKTKSDDRRLVRAFATRTVLEKTDRLLGWDGRVRIIAPHDNAGQHEVPGWTNGEVITLNGQAHALYRAFDRGLNATTTMMITGLNYHELAHCLFTPRLDCDLVAEARRKNMWMAFNILEDQAAESKFVRRYLPAGHYFTTVVSTFLAERKDLIAVNYPLVSGRRYLPDEIRQLFRDNYIRQQDLDEIDEVVSEYVDCIYPDDKNRMRQLIEKMQRLISKLQLDSGSAPSMTSHHGQGSGSGEAENNPNTGLQRGKPLSVEEQREIVNKIRQGEIGELLGRSKSGSEDGSQGAESGSPQGESEDGPDGSTGDQGGEASDDVEAIDFPGGRGAGNDPDFTSTKWEPGLLDDLVDQAVSSSTEAMADELENRRAAIRESLDSYYVDAQIPPYSERPIDPYHISAARDVERELRRLRQRFKPSWQSRQDTGKVDANQLAKIRRGQNDVFKRWNEGVHNATDMEVVILLDQSGSMYHMAQEAGSAMWVLYRALRNLGAEVTVLGYSDGNTCSVLIQRGEETPKSLRTYFSGGPTYVMPALREARRIFSTSRKPMKILEIVTDGVFSDPALVKQELLSMEHPVAIIGINEDVAERWKVDEIQALKASKTISTPMDLVEFTRRFVTRMINERYVK